MIVIINAIDNSYTVFSIDLTSEDLQLPEVNYKKRKIEKKRLLSNNFLPLEISTTIT